MWIMHRQKNLFVKNGKQTFEKNARMSGMGGNCRGYT